MNLEQIELKKTQLAEIGRIIKQHEDKKEELSSKRKDKERVISSLNKEYLENEKLKKRINNFPRFKFELFLISLLVILLMTVPISLLLAFVSLISKTMIFNAISLVYFVFILSKVVLEYKDDLKQEKMLLDNLTIEELEISNSVIKGQMKQLNLEVTNLNGLIDDITKLIETYNSQGNKIKEEFNHFLSCVDNPQLDNDSEKKLDAEKKLTLKRKEC